MRQKILYIQSLEYFLDGKYSREKGNKYFCDKKYFTYSRETGMTDGNNRQEIFSVFFWRDGKHFCDKNILHSQTRDGNDRSKGNI